MRGKLSIPEPRTWFPAELSSTTPFPSLSEGSDQGIPLKKPIQWRVLHVCCIKRLTSSKFGSFFLFDYFFGLKNLGKWKLIPSLWLVPKFHRIWTACGCSIYIGGLFWSLPKPMNPDDSPGTFIQSFLWPFWEISTKAASVAVIID